MMTIQNVSSEVQVQIIFFFMFFYFRSQDIQDLPYLPSHDLPYMCRHNDC